MNIEERNKRLSEIENRINSIRDELKEIRQEKHKLLLEGVDVVGKFLDLGERGYMFVTYQEFRVANDSEEVWLRGFYFNGNPGNWTDEYYLDYDAMYSLYIGTRVFLYEYLETNEIHEISEDEFRNKFNELSEKCNALSMSMIDRCKNSLID